MADVAASWHVTTAIDGFPWSADGEAVLRARRFRQYADEMVRSWCCEAVLRGGDAGRCCALPRCRLPCKATPKPRPAPPP